MTALTDIRRGIAAELVAVLPSSEGQAYPWLLDSPATPSLMVAGLDKNGMEDADFGGGKKFLIVVEGCLGLASEIGAQALLDEWATDVPDTLEALNSSAGCLTKRMDDAGAITTGHSAACDSISLFQYRGHGPFTLRDGREVLLAGWTFEVLT